MSGAVELEGTVALVTGASAGIGRALAVGLARAGARVGLLARDRARLDATLQECGGAGDRAVVVPADVTVATDVARAVDVVERELGPVDLLVNNAGRIERREVPLWEADPAEWVGVLEANLVGPFLLARAVVPGMLRRGGGRVVNLSSGAALRDWEIHSAYTASKTGLARLTGALSRAGAEHGVRAFDVSPGHVRTAMTEGMAMHAGKGPGDWTPPEKVVDLVLAIAAGQLDALSGRHVRAGTDDVETLRARAGAILASDARTLRLRPYGPDDPLG